MSSLVPGKDTSPVEVTNISSHGFWIFFRGRELFLAYEDFPWFKDQTVKVLCNIEELSEGHFFWPDLDVDLSEEIIENPGKYPLKAKIL